MKRWQISYVIILIIEIIELFIILLRKIVNSILSCSTSSLIRLLYIFYAMDICTGVGSIPTCSTVRISIDIAHRVDSQRLSPEENVQLFGKCNREGGHGHRWTISVTAEHVPHFKLLSIVRMAIEDNFDHRNLNLATSCPHMSGIVPTVENFLYVASALLKQVCIAEQIDPYKLKRIRLFETRTSSISWDLTQSDIDHLQVGQYDAINQDLAYTPVMSVTKRFEAWYNHDRIVVDIDKTSLFRCEGPGGGFPCHACNFDITLKGQLDTRKSAVELLGNVKEVLQSAVRQWAGRIDGITVGDLKDLFQLCQQQMQCRNMNPNKLVEIHWEKETLTVEDLSSCTSNRHDDVNHYYFKRQQLNLEEITYRP